MSIVSNLKSTFSDFDAFFWLSLVIEALFVHNSTGEFALVHQNHKAVRALMTPTTRIPVTVPDACISSIDEEIYCIFANGRDFSTGNASTGQLQLSSSLTMVKRECDLAIVNRCFTGNWDFGRRRRVHQNQQKVLVY